ncbi:hypothetical protein FJZ36_00855 [Candidatus Poribacteria bacterium]|nr:hypothetical protein [Candidatus Poribacteria bacterium]
MSSWLLSLAVLAAVPTDPVSRSEDHVLPPGVRVVWDLADAHRRETSTRGEVSLNGLWRWQPAKNLTDAIPTEAWGYCRVPGPWPGSRGNYMWRDSQTSYPHPDWASDDLRLADMAWYEREIMVPTDWKGRRIAVSFSNLSSYAVVYVDGVRAGDVSFPGGEADITSACRPGSTHRLSVFVAALPLHEDIVSYANSAEERRTRGTVALRGLCGDVSLVSEPVSARIKNVRVEPSFRRGTLGFGVRMDDLEPARTYLLRAQVRDGDSTAVDVTSAPFNASDLEAGRFAFSLDWVPPKLWDTHTPENQYVLNLSLIDDHDGGVRDVFWDTRFGFREFWVDGRDFRLNGSRVHFFAVPLDSAQVGAAAASYAGARETLERLQAIGVGLVYTHNYSCQPGEHLAFEEILRAADDVGMLVSFTLPHFSQYDWDAEDADQANGYAEHAEAYIRMAQNHPSVVMYAMSHNATGYSEDMNPFMIDGIQDDRDGWALRNMRKALRAETIARGIDGSRVLYHHAGGNLGEVYTSNFYLNWTPVQERSDWFEHWATTGVKPLFLCEYGEPWGIDWTMYRGWYEGKRDFGGASIPWQFTTAQWNAPFLGDDAYALNDLEKRNLRWEAGKWRNGERWHRWDYPTPIIGSFARIDGNQEAVWALYVEDNWRAFRTWGVSGRNAWSYGNFWLLDPDADRSRRALPVDWERQQTPGYVADFIDAQYERLDFGFERSDWIPTSAGRAFLRNNGPLLAYIAGKPGAFTEKSHVFAPGEAVEKQIVVINDSRLPVRGMARWSLDGADSVRGEKPFYVETGEQVRIPLRFQLPASISGDTVTIRARIEYQNGEVGEDLFTLDILPAATTPTTSARIALFDPKGETRAELDRLGFAYDPVDVGSDLGGFDVLVIGKQALTEDGAAPDLSRVRDGLRVLVFEQEANVLQNRLGFRVQEFGLRNAFPRVPNHPVLAGIGVEHLHDWRGEATLTSPRLTYTMRPMHGPTVEWCGIEVTRPWRCGNRGNIASVMIEKPATGDFLPLVDGGFDQQYSPLMVFREGNGAILFCQMDVTGRTAQEPAAARLLRNLIAFADAFAPSPRRRLVYAGGESGRAHLSKAGFELMPYGSSALGKGDLLVVAEGASSAFAKNRDGLSDWLAHGGRALAIDLNADEASRVLPTAVTTSSEEYFGVPLSPTGVHSPFAGVASSDVHTRDPRTIPLISSGADLLAGGVLASSIDGRIAFCQLAPWLFDHEAMYNVKITFRRTSFLLSRLLSNLGVQPTAPLVERFSTPREDGEQRWLTGLYLETPVEMDDPYRFFRW